MTDTSKIDKAAQKAAETTEKTAARAHDRIESTRERVAKALDGADTGVDRASDELARTIEALARHVNALGDQTQDVLHKAGQRAADNWDDAAARTRAYATEKPLTALGLAAAGGALLALLLGRRH